MVSKVTYKGKLRKMLAAYDKIGDATEIITTHPISDKEINQRINSGRWIYEENQN